MMGDESVPNTTLLEQLHNVYSKIGALKIHKLKPDTNDKMEMWTIHK